jgi:hypothetical protein
LGEMRDRSFENQRYRSRSLNVGKAGEDSSRRSTGFRY